MVNTKKNRVWMCLVWPEYDPQYLYPFLIQGIAVLLQML